MINPNFLHLILLPFAPFMRMKFAGSFCPLHSLKGKLIEILFFLKPRSNILRKRSLSLSKRKTKKQKPQVFTVMENLSVRKETQGTPQNDLCGRKFVVLVLSAEGLKELQRV